MNCKHVAKHANKTSKSYTLPTFTTSHQIDSIPLREKEQSKKGILQNINIQYSSKAENRASFADDLLSKEGYV